MALAAFDFDGTLVKGDAGVHFGRYLVGRGYLHAFDDGIARGVARLTRLNANVAYQTTRGALLHARYARGRLDRHGVVERAYRAFAGLDPEWVRREMQAFAHTHLHKKLRKSAWETLRAHVEKGDKVVVISTGSRDLIWPLREVVDLDFEVLACTLRAENGHLTGTVEGPLNGAEKAMRLRAIASRRGHDLAEAYAYSDHEDDAAVLEIVGHPVVVAPTRAMRKVAGERGWPVLPDRRG